MSRVVVVTGARGNLGSVVCAHYAAAGDQVVRVERSGAFYGERMLSEVDLSCREATHTLFQRVHETLGRIDVVVHTVGTFRMSGVVEDWDDATLRLLFDTNVVPTAHVLSAALPILRAQGAGHVVVVVSTAAERGAAGVGAYSATKAAQLRLVESAATEVARSAVSVHAVSPGTMDTPQNRAAMPHADRSRWVTLEEVAQVIATVASPVGLPMNGQELRVARD